ncbi:MAG TPA: hypothetical protein VLX68_04045 [Chitinivibrionales bacterium]|nr:hypothetical protein [Chitinivibrionales bacterium]
MNKIDDSAFVFQAAMIRIQRDKLLAEHYQIINPTGNAERVSYRQHAKAGDLMIEWHSPRIPRDLARG